jgi:plasmid stability protein
MEKEAKIQLRLPSSLRDWFRVFAAKHNRSMNGQIVAIFTETKAAEEKTMDKVAA